MTGVVGKTFLSRDLGMGFLKNQKGRGGDGGKILKIEENGGAFLDRCKRASCPCRMLGPAVQWFFFFGVVLELLACLLACWLACLVPFPGIPGRGAQAGLEGGNNYGLDGSYVGGRVCEDRDL